MQKKDLEIIETFPILRTVEQWKNFRLFFAKKEKILDRAVHVRVTIFLEQRKSVFQEILYLQKVVRELVDCGFVLQEDILSSEVYFVEDSESFFLVELRDADPAPDWE